MRIRIKQRIWALIIGIVILAIPFLLGSYTSEGWGFAPVESKYTINSLNLDCNVLENGSVDITYDVAITMNANKEMREMLVSIPYYGKLYSKEDGKLVVREYSAKVSNFKLIDSSESVNLKTYNDSNDEDCPQNCVMVGLKKSYGKYESSASYSFKFSYNYKMNNQKVNNLDELYLNLLGTNSSATINNVSFKITFPKTIDFAEFVPAVYYGPVGQAHEYTDFITTDKTIQTNSTINLNAYESLTLRQFAPEGYFAYAKISNVPMILVIVFTVLGLAAIIVLKIVARQHGEVPSPVELVAPKDILPNEAEFVVYHQTSNKVFAASIVWLASHGYIKIEETETETYLIKTKEPDKTLDANLQSVLNSLKGDGEKTEIGELATTGMSLVISEIKKSPETKYKGEIFNKNSTRLLNWADILFVALMVINVGLLFLQVYCAVGFMSASSLPLRWMVGGKLILPLNAILLATWFISPVPQYNNKTELGQEFITKRGRMLGLQKYIKMVEEPQLKMFAKEKPSLFYDILPYAYVLGVSDIWIDKFKTINIPSPEWIDGDQVLSAYWFASFTSRSFNVAERAHYKAFSEGAKGFSSFGGGSFGGGGFSGGGGGGASFGGR